MTLKFSKLTELTKLTGPEWLAQSQSLSDCEISYILLQAKDRKDRQTQV